MKIVYIILTCTTVVTAYETESHTYNHARVRKPIGGCVTLEAKHYYKYNKSTEKVRWTKDMKPLEDSERETVSGKSLKVTSLRKSDFAFYQVIIEGFLDGDPNIKVTETTNFWINTIGCRDNQRENTPTSAKACETLCEDACTEGWIHVPGTIKKCVKYIKVPLPWVKAGVACQAMGAELTTINNPSENRFIGTKLKSGLGSWIGLNDRIEEANYVWNFNSNKHPTFSPLPWSENEPNNYNRNCNIENCIVMKKENGKWNDIICGAFNSYICEVEKTSYNETDLDNWSCLGSKCYKFFWNYLVWHKALLRCKSLHSSGKLATIFSLGENKFVQTLIEGNMQHTAWIGLNDIWEAGSYSWNKYEGSPIKNPYVNWDKGEPNDKYTKPNAGKCSGEDCIQLKSTKGSPTWQDLSCDTKLPYLCEKIRDRTYTTGGVVGIVIGTLILLATIGGFAHLTYLNRQRTAVKDIIRDAYTDDLSTRESGLISSRNG